MSGGWGISPQDPVGVIRMRVVDVRVVGGGYDG